MNKLFVIVAAVFCVTVPAFAHAESGSFEKRCGWFNNPTPGNIWLTDRDAEWIIGVQGGYQVKNEWAWPDFKPDQWIITNSGEHGYGCACMTAIVDHATRHVLKIKKVQERPLAACRGDKTLHEPPRPEDFSDQ